MLTLIVAVNNNGTIGLNGTMPWHNREDLQHFKHTTMGKTVVMGRKTVVGLPGPLPGRRVLTVSSSQKGADVIGDFEAFLQEHAQSHAEIFIAGGGQIYAQAIPYVSKILVSVIDDNTQGDTVFPVSYLDAFKLTDTKHLSTFTLKTYERDIDMRMVDIIAKKRDGHELSNEEIKFWIEGVTRNDIPEYQTSALLMAIVLKGMNDDETASLTTAMLHSGDMIDLSAIHGHKVDKHSTGGVGDKTTMILSPIVAAAGGKVAKMSGRGLGHTGGTLDKLEAIEGFNIALDSDRFINQVNDLNIAVVGQTGNLVYADKVLYSLRDVTATVDSIPLIAASIMSKKLAGGADCILLDVKYGDGAFMKTVDDARKLATSMIAIGEKLGRKVNAMLTNMNQPLGHNIGNALEVAEAIETLNNRGPRDLEELCLVASGYMLYHSELADSPQAGYDLALETLRSGAAYEVFKKWIAAQDGHVETLDDLVAFTKANYKLDVVAAEAGSIHDLKAMDLGLVSMHLGAGRATKEDVIDYKAGIVLAAAIGDTVSQGDLLATLYSNTPISEKFIHETQLCFVIRKEAVDAPVLIADIL